MSGYNNLPREHLRTYKVGLRVPESLLTEQNQLLIERELLYYLKNAYYNKKSTLFSKKLQNANKSTLVRYTQVYESFKSLSLKEIQKKINQNKQALQTIQRHNPMLSSPSFTKKDLPTFTYKKDEIIHFHPPTPQEISLHDYQYVANNSLKVVSTHLNTIVMDNISSIPSSREELIREAFELCKKEGRGYSESQLRNRIEIALACKTGIHSNLGRTAFYQLGAALGGYFDVRQKAQAVSTMLHREFIDTIPIFLTYYSIPRHLLLFLSNSWNVDAQWIRNTLVGWRRKLDPYLPRRFQIERLNELFMDLAEYYNQYASSDEELKVIRIFQKKHILHVLPHKNIDLSKLLPRNLRNSYINLQNMIKPLPSELQSSLERHLTSISENEFKEAAFELLKKVKENMGQFPLHSTPYRNCKTYIKKIQTIIEHVDTLQMKELLLNTIVRNRFTGAVARLYHTSKYSRLFTTFRGIFSITLAGKFSSAIGQFTKVFTPDNCITLPFTSKKRKKHQLPVNLLFNKYIVIRKASPISTGFLTNKGGVSTRFKENKPIWLGLPIYSQDQLRHGVLQGKKKGTFWFRLLPSKKIVKCLQKGAIVRDIRLNIPKGPTRKIIADIVLSSSDISCFYHEGSYLKAWDEKYSQLQLPSHTILGVDFNHIGKHMVVVANPKSKLDISSLMEFYESMYRKLELYRKCEIPHIQSKIDKVSNDIQVNSKRIGRLKTQITLLHQKQQNIMKQMKQQAIMLYLFIAYKTNAHFLSWDSIGGISTKGKSGALAQAITYLPKQKDLFDTCKQWAEDLKNQELLPYYKDIIPVSSYTSQVCAHCFQNTGKLRKTLVKGVPYDTFQCKVCAKSSNRHSNAAQVSALFLEQILHEKQIIISSPLTMG